MNSIKFAGAALGAVMMAGAFTAPAQAALSCAPGFQVTQQTTRSVSCLKMLIANSGFKARRRARQARRRALNHCQAHMMTPKIVIRRVLGHRYLAKISYTCAIIY